jgi:hypothetical protein
LLHWKNARVCRAAYTGDGREYPEALADLLELARRLGNPRLPMRNIALYTPPYYLERNEYELGAALVQKGEKLCEVLPKDERLRRYVQVYRGCLDSCTAEEDTAEESLAAAEAAARAVPFRHLNLVLVYKARFELARGRRTVSAQAATEVLSRATSREFSNPFDEILARRAVAAVTEGAERTGHLYAAAEIARETGNILQDGIVNLTLATILQHDDATKADAHRKQAEQKLTAAKAGWWLDRLKNSTLQQGTVD